MQGIAHLKYNHRSASKVRQVLNLVRGKSVVEARQILKYCQRGAAEEVLKLLNSAVANAEFLHQLDAEQLLVKEAFANEAPTMKRVRPRARGRADRVFKRTSHITISVEPILADSTKGKKAVVAKVEDKSEARAKRIAASKKADKVKEAPSKDKDSVEESETSKKAPVKKAAVKKPAAKKETTEKTETKKAAAKKPAAKKESTDKTTEKGEK